MEFKDILVHIDNSAQCASRVKLAVRLAEDHGAHLTGLYVINHPYYASQGDARKEQVKQAKEMFQSETSGTGIGTEYLCADWNVSGDSMVEILNYHAYRKDLIIVGQSVQEKAIGDIPADLPERVVLGSGRPVLVVPYAGHFVTVGERVVVGWRAGRESSRAIHDAMPILAKAKQVFVVAVTSGDQPPADRCRDDSILAHLARHHIAVKEETLESGDVPVDKVLMNYAWERGCDLLVMGVHTRGGVHIGPVAKLFFEQMTFPVLMSH